MRIKNENQAFTVLELMVVVVVVFIIAGLILPTIVRPRHVPALRIHCVNNLKQVGLAFRLWSDDHNNTYPMSFLTNQSGGLLFADATNGFRYFQVMSNELSTPKILVCPADKRIAATNFTTDFSGGHLSYLVGLQADEARPAAFLSGDRNITNGQKPINGILELQTNQNIGWTSELHNRIWKYGGGGWQRAAREPERVENVCGEYRAGDEPAIAAAVATVCAQRKMPLPWWSCWW